MPRKKKKKRSMNRPMRNSVKGQSMGEAIGQDAALDHIVPELLEYYSCPYPFSQVRAGFMGNVASPDLRVKPLREVERAWDGELPEFRSDDEINAFMQILVMGFYNKMCSHLESDNPFKLMEMEPVIVSPVYVGLLANTRSREIEGFIGGLFCGLKDIDLPKTASEAVESLSEKRESFASAENMIDDPPEQWEEESLKKMIENFREMTKAAEEEINVVIQSCKAARMKAVDMLFKDNP